MLKSPPQTLQSLGGAAEAAAVLVVPTPGALPAAPGLVARAGGRGARCGAGTGSPACGCPREGKP